MLWFSVVFSVFAFADHIQSMSSSFLTTAFVASLGVTVGALIAVTVSPAAPAHFYAAPTIAATSAQSAVAGGVPQVRHINGGVLTKSYPVTQVSVQNHIPIVLFRSVLISIGVPNLCSRAPLGGWGWVSGSGLRCE